MQRPSYRYPEKPYCYPNRYLIVTLSISIT